MPFSKKNELKTFTNVKANMPENIVVLNYSKWNAPKKVKRFVIPDDFQEASAYVNAIKQKRKKDDIMMYLKCFDKFFIKSKYDLNEIHTFVEDIWLMEDRTFNVYMVLQNPNDANPCLIESANKVF